MKKKNKPTEQPTATIEQPSTSTAIPSIVYVGGYRIGSRNNRDGCLGWEWIDATKN